MFQTIIIEVSHRCIVLKNSNLRFLDKCEICYSGTMWIVGSTAVGRNSTKTATAATATAAAIIGRATSAATKAARTATRTFECMIGRYEFILLILLQPVTLTPATTTNSLSNLASLAEQPYRLPVRLGHYPARVRL